MQHASFLAPVNLPRRPLARWWLLLGALALALGGLYSLVLVVARTPQLASMPLFVRLFHEALVVHVDLTVLVWFLAIACTLWSMAARQKIAFPFIEESALLAVLAGMVFICLSPLDSSSSALMSNYIPVIHSPLFFLGLMLILVGVLFMLVRFGLGRPSPLFSPPLNFALAGAAVITLISLAAFVWSGMQMPAPIEGAQYYELLFWGGGHVLQFTHTQMLMISWLLLAAALVPGFSPNPKLLYGLFCLGPLAALASPLAYLLYSVTDGGHRQFFTHLMIAGNGIAPAVLAMLLIAPLLASKKATSPQRALWSSLFMSWLLFLYGGFLGLLIQGQNVVIPAHYHGSIVGITLAFMGLAYLLLPMFGYRPVAGWRMAYWQPYVYGLGQLMHISGLAYSGGYGVLRKTPGVIADISLSVKIALGFMGLGGLIAIIGGFMFVVVVARSVFSSPG